jgi:antitoxin component YwqK of YwqJK toxin-antitoxin module
MKGLFLSCMVFFMVSAMAQNKVDERGRKQGVWSKNHEGSKALLYKGQFKNDKPVGTFMYYYTSNKVKAVVKHDAGTNRSFAVYYFENGVVMSTGAYRDLKKDSVWLNYDPAPRLKFKETYANDSLDGLKTIYYVPSDPHDRSQKVSGLYNYKAGLMDGEMIEYFDTGSLRTKGTYKDNKRIGLWEFYQINGKLMIQERYRDGVRHGWCKAFDESGKETNSKYYSFGKLLEGKALEAKMKEYKEKGINPNN